MPRRLWPSSSHRQNARRGCGGTRPGHLEARGDPQHYVSSKLMCWVALDRAASSRRSEGTRARPDLDKTAREIHQDILDHGVSDRGVLKQHYDTEALDASTLLARSWGSCPGPTTGCTRGPGDRRRADGERLRAPVQDRRDRRRDGRKARSSSARSGWCRASRSSARSNERAASWNACSASPLRSGCTPRSTTWTGRHLGNVPQAFSHLALIEAAGRIILAGVWAPKGRCSIGFS